MFNHSLWSLSFQSTSLVFVTKCLELSSMKAIDIFLQAWIYLLIHSKLQLVQCQTQITLTGTSLKNNTVVSQNLWFIWFGYYGFPNRSSFSRFYWTFWLLLSINLMKRLSAHTQSKTSIALLIETTSTTWFKNKVAKMNNAFCLFFNNKFMIMKITNG